MLLLASLIIVMVGVFAGLLMMMRKIMSQNVSAATKHLDEMNQDFLKKEEELNRRLSEAETQSKQIVIKASQEAMELKAKMLKDAETARDEILQQARAQSQAIIDQAEKSRQVLLTEMDQHIAKGASARAVELISQTLPDSFKQQVHTHWIEELIENSFTAVENLHIPQDLKEVSITSAFPLTDSQRTSLARKVREVIGRDVALKEEVDPKVCAGVIIAMGSLILDGSLRNKIQEQTRHDQRA